MKPGRALRIYGETLAQLKWATLTVAAVLALAYVMNLSAQTLTIGNWIAGAGGILAFLSPIIGWLGVAVTGSDTSSNSLFGVLQVTAAKEAGLDQTLLAAANSSGGVLGKMISPQNLAIGAAAVGMAGKEGDLFRRVVGWSLLCLLVMCVLVYLQSTRAVVDGRLTSLVEELRGICGDRWTYTAEHDLRTYESDGLLQYHATPVAAVLPGSAEEVQAVRPGVRARGRPVGGARGSGSGLSGGALPVADGVLIVVSRLKRILEIDLDNQRICVEPGVTNASVTAAVAPPFFYPPDPSSQIVCSIGGNVAENSGGAHCFKYGFTTNYVCGLELVLADGEMITVGGRSSTRRATTCSARSSAPRARSASPRRCGCGSCPRRRPSRRSSRSSTPRTRPARRSRRSCRPASCPGAIEMMDELAIEASEQMAHAGYPVGRGAALLVELDGAEQECEARFEEVVAICERCGSDDVRVARDEAERQLFWKTRKAAFPAMGRISPNYFVQDGVIPRTKLPEVLDTSRRWRRSTG